MPFRAHVFRGHLAGLVIRCRVHVEKLLGELAEERRIQLRKDCRSRLEFRSFAVFVGQRFGAVFSS
jgi:hypothetical protein